MIGLDTNVIVRYLAQDEPKQSQRATRLVETELTPSDPGYLSLVVIAETAWVLERAYGLTHERIAAVIEAMLQSAVLVLENEQDVFAAAVAVKDGLGTFADALIARLGERAGCTHTLTFDCKAARMPAYRLFH